MKKLGKVKTVPAILKSHKGKYNIAQKAEMAFNRYKKGEHLPLIAKETGIGITTIGRVIKIKKAAEGDSEITKKWDDALKGDGTINSVYQIVKNKRKKVKTKVKVHGDEGKKAQVKFTKQFSKYYDKGGSTPIFERAIDAMDLYEELVDYKKKHPDTWEDRIKEHIHMRKSVLKL